MTGTSFSVTEAMRVTPPRKMKAATTARITPTIQVGTPRAVLEGVADGVGLDHVAGEAQGEDDGQGEEARQESCRRSP